MPRQKKKDNQTVATVENLEIKIEQAMERVLAGMNFTVPEMLRIGDVAKMLSMSTPTVRKLINTGQLPFYLTAGGKRFKREDVMDYINSLEPNKG